MKKTGAVLAAAGMSSRMKDFKPMLPFGGTTIAVHIVTMLKELGLEPIVVVTGCRAEQLEAHLSHLGVQFVRNERFRETEMFDSVCMGLKAIEGQCERVLLMPVDTPAIMPETIRRVLLSDAPLARTSCGGKPGHPILISCKALPAICGYRGNRGLRGAMEESGIPITELEVEDEGVYLDVDTREEYKRLVEWNYNRGDAYPIKAKTQVRLIAGEPFFGPGVCRLLELIDQTGSVQEACLRMTLSYSKGGRMLRALDKQLGFSVVQRWAGGSGGGGSALTEEGRRLVKAYRAMEAEVQESTEQIYRKYFKEGIRREHEK